MLFSNNKKEIIKQRYKVMNFVQSIYKEKRR